MARRLAARLILILGLLVGVAVSVRVGWAGWVIRHPDQIWQWIKKHLLASTAIGVVVAAVSVWVAWVTLRWQQRQAAQLADDQERREQEDNLREEQRIAREQEQAAAERKAAWEKRCRSLLVYWPLPELTNGNPYELGVFYSRRADAYRGDQARPPYVARAADEELAVLLQTKSLVLVKGQSRAGKSRTAFEVAARELPGFRLLVPKDCGAVTELVELDPLPGQGEQVLVWLDDLDRFLAVEGIPGLDAQVLARWAACDPPMKVLATIRLEEYGRLTETAGPYGRSVRELLNRFDPGAITLPVIFDSPAEQAAIAKYYPGEQFTGGLAEHLSAVSKLVDRLEGGQACVPEGAGLVLAAVDCRRAGLDRSVSKAELAALLPLYLKRLRPLIAFRGEDVDRGLDWATELVGRTAALLVADPGPLAGTFSVADPIIDYVERRDGRKLIHPEVWEYLLGRVSVEEAMRLAFAAKTRDEPHIARVALQQVINSGDLRAGAEAELALGMLLFEQGDWAGLRQSAVMADAGGLTG